VIQQQNRDMMPLPVYESHEEARKDAFLVEEFSITLAIAPGSA
jgi:hypothetical protein